MVKGGRERGGMRGEQRRGGRGRGEERRERGREETDEERMWFMYLGACKFREDSPIDGRGDGLDSLGDGLVHLLLLHLPEHSTGVGDSFHGDGALDTVAALLALHVHLGRG